MRKGLRGFFPSLAEAVKDYLTYYVTCLSPSPTYEGEMTMEFSRALSVAAVGLSIALSLFFAEVDATHAATIPISGAAGSLQLSSTTYSRGEAGTLVTITATRTGGSSGVAGVSYSTSNGTAAAGADYTTTSGILSWGDGDTAGKTFAVPITNDTLDEANETFRVTLSTPTGGATLGVPATAKVTITDNDVQPTVEFSAAAANGSEAVTPAVFTVTLAAASAKTVKVNYATAGNTATAGSDYSTTAGTLTFNPGVTSRTISVPITNDPAVEGDEAFSVTLSDPLNATLGTTITQTYTINNDDSTPTLGTLTPSVLGSAPAIAKKFTAIYRDADGYRNIKQAYLRVHTVANGIYLRYDRTTNKLFLYNNAGTAPVGSCTPGAIGTLTNTQGSLNCAATTVAGSGNTLTIKWSIKPKAAFASATKKNLYLFARDMSNATAGWTDKGDWTITPSIALAAGSIQLSAATSRVAEDRGRVVITATRTDGSSGAVGASYSTGNGTARAGSDYAFASGMLSWANGDTANKKFTVAITNDAINEPNETFTVNLASPTGGATLGSPSSATVTIVHNDLIQLSALGGMTATPFTSLTILGTGLTQAKAAVSVRFIPQNGNPAMTLPVSAPSLSSVQVMVPPLFDPATGSSISGAVDVQVIQVSGTAVLTSNLITGLQIGALLPTPTSTPLGAITSAFLSSALNVFSSTQSSGPTLSQLAATSPNYSSNLSALISAVNAITADPSTSVSLSTANGSTITLDANALRLSDQMVQALVAELASKTQVPAPAAAAATMPNAFSSASLAPASASCPLYPNDPLAYDTNLCWTQRFFQNMTESPAVTAEMTKALANLAAGVLPVPKYLANQLIAGAMWTFSYSLLTTGVPPPGGDVVEGVATTTLDSLSNTSGMIGFTVDAYNVFRLAATTFPSRKGMAPVAMGTSDAAGNTYLLLRDGSTLVTVPTAQGTFPVDSLTLVVPSCTSYSYSAWSACQPNNTKTRSVTSSSPAGCTGGAPVLSQSCTYTPPTCDLWHCDDECFTSWVNCYDACPSSPASVAYSCMSACDDAYWTCPSYTDPDTCLCSSGL